MHTVLTRRSGLFIIVSGVLGVAACGEVPPGEELMQGEAVASMNGMAMNGMAMNGMSMNGMAMNGLAMNGMAMNGMAMNGLSTVGGLSSTSGLMTTAGGRDIVTYMIRCAYPAGQSLVKQDQYGNSYTFAGSIGIAPEAAAGPCDLDCQEKISACMLAHVNNSGQHISIWMVGPDPGIGWGGSSDFPYQEGAFFGNIFASPWQGYYCAGKDMASGEVPGRLGTPMASTVYVDPYGAGALCNKPGNCTVTNEGYTNCNDPALLAPYTAGHKWTHVVTVWRDFEATQMYKICNLSGYCLGVVGGSTADGASVEQRTYSGALTQNWQILLMPSSGTFEIVNVASGLALDASNTQIVQRRYSGTSGELFPIRYIKDQPGAANLVLSTNTKNGLYGVSANNGALVQLSTNLASSYGRWTFAAVGPVAAASTETTLVASGSSTGTNPCAAFCASPTVFTTANYWSGNLGTGQVCRETTAALSGTNLSNMAGRVFRINGVAFVADGNISALPAPVNGGYCFQATAGGADYAAFATW